MKISKKWKKHLEISSFYISLPKIMIIWNTVPEIWHMADVIIFHFGPFTAQKNQNFKKMKKFLKILWFYICAPKIMIRWCTVLEKWCTTDRQKKWHTEVGVPPKNSDTVPGYASLSTDILQTSSLHIFIKQL